MCYIIILFTIKNDHSEHGNNARKFISEVYYLWAEKKTQDGCHSLTRNPFSQK